MKRAQISVIGDSLNCSGCCEEFFGINRNEPENKKSKKRTAGTAWGQLGTDIIV